MTDRRPEMFSSLIIFDRCNGSGVPSLDPLSFAFRSLAFHGVMAVMPRSGRLYVRAKRVRQERSYEKMKGKMKKATMAPKCDLI